MTSLREKLAALPARHPFAFIGSENCLGAIAVSRGTDRAEAFARLVAHAEYFTCDYGRGPRAAKGPAR